MKIAALTLIAALAISNSVAAQQDDESADAKQLRHQSEAAASIAALAPEEFCFHFGETIRDGHYAHYFSAGKEYSVAMFTKEARRRRLPLTVSGVTSAKLRVGMSSCELLAYLGRPVHSNRTVTKAGEHLQMVYPFRYVYVRNGVVTGWQD